jgi:hypothetical protein
LAEKSYLRKNEPFKNKRKNKSINYPLSTVACPGFFLAGAEKNIRGAEKN